MENSADQASATGVAVDDVEQRSVHAEQDYRRKDAVRHIVAEQGSSSRR